ncbi:MAG: acyl-CoA thioesterase, partial [Thermoanaerobaculia bacterium]
MHDDINPKFTYLSPVHFDELDAMRMLHNARFPSHVERAVTAWFGASGNRWHLDPTENPDQFHVVRDLHIEYLNPFLGPGTMRIDIWVERIGSTSCVYGFHCTSEDGVTPFARGERTVVKIDPHSHRPSPWSETFRRQQSTLQKDLPSYA